MNRHLRGFATLVGLMLLPPSGTAQLTTGLVGYWAFDEGSGTTAGDSSSQGNTGTLMNSPTWVTGHSGGGLAFNGTNQRVQITSPVGLPTGNATRSVVAWVKLTGEVVTSGTNRYQSLVSWGTPGSNTQLFSVERGADLNPDKVFALGWNDDAHSNTTGAFPLNQWAHIAVIFDGTVVSFFVNGVADGSTSRTYNTVLNASGLVIGNVDSNDGWHLGFNGVIDELYVYNRALSSGEINQLMASPIPEPAATAALLNLVALGFVVIWRRRVWPPRGAPLRAPNGLLAASAAPAAPGQSVGVTGTSCVGPTTLRERAKIAQVARSAQQFESSWRSFCGFYPMEPVGPDQLRLVGNKRMRP